MSIPTPATRKNLLKKFAELYPNPRSELSFSNEYELVTAVVLSAQCTDKKVNEVTPKLFKRYPSFKALAKAEVSEVEEIIRQVNYYKTKSKNLIGLGQKVEKDFGGTLPSTEEDLTSLPGVGRKTANVVLSEQGKTPALPVDTHVFRVSQRLGLAKGKTTDKVEEELKALFEPAQWRNLHHWLIFHGRRVCKAQNPLCAACTLRELCPSRKE
jgi:endonuclease-3